MQNTTKDLNEKPFIHNQLSVFGKSYRIKALFYYLYRIGLSKLKIWEFEFEHEFHIRFDSLGSHPTANLIQCSMIFDDLTFLLYWQSGNSPSEIWNGIWFKHAQVIAREERVFENNSAKEDQHVR